MMKSVTAILILFMSAASFVCADDHTPGKLEVSGAEHRLEKLEKKVERAHGQPFGLSYEGKEALQRIKALNEKYPKNAKVQELFERARNALLASKGESMKITPDMLVYRENEKKLAAIFKKEATIKWDGFKAELNAQEGSLIDAFPQPDYKEISLDDVIGKYIVLDDFEYPTNMFTDNGQQHLFVGSDLKGYYFVNLEGRNWLGPYEAIKRYRRFINQDLPEGMKWTVVGKITGPRLMIPQSGSEKTKAPQWGWSVDPVAIYVPDRTFSTVDEKLELGGSFAGEERMEELKGALYTVTEIPTDITPERLTEIYATAIKEKNYPLYIDAIDPSQRATNTALAQVMYHWEWHQKRFAEFYVHIVPNDADVYVIKGFDKNDDLEAAFLTVEELQEIRKISEPLVEEARLTTAAYDERGRQYGSLKPRVLRRKEKGRWYIYNYKQPF